MGSLERVQYKFASIIGELCSEPIVLSQFAVWLDLKLAEYKAKGSISLDCSGEKPEPPWMKGVLPSSPPSSLFEHKNPDDDIPSGSSSFRNPSHRSSAPYSSSTRVQHSPSVTSPSQSFGTEELDQKLSADDIVLIKDEPSESVFPTNLYSNESGLSGSDSFSESRKRHVPSEMQQSFTSKVRRMPPASASGSPSSASNQSNPGAVRESPSHDPTGLSEEPMIVPSSHDQAAESTSQSSWLGQVTAERDSDTTVPLNLGGTDARTSQWPVNHAGTAAPTQWSGYNRRGEGRRVNSTQRNINASVHNFERWLRKLPTAEKRRIHQIEPEKLDEYLAEFYKVVKKPSGEDYSPFSLGVYRSSFAKYLKFHNYPHSILRSNVFTNSRNAFIQRKLELTAKGPAPPRAYYDDSPVGSPSHSRGPQW